MSIAVLADVHGNLPALRAALAEVDTLGVRPQRPTRSGPARMSALIEAVGYIK